MVDLQVLMSWKFVEMMIVFDTPDGGKDDSESPTKTNQQRNKVTSLTSHTHREGMTLQVHLNRIRFLNFRPSLQRVEAATGLTETKWDGFQPEMVNPISAPNAHLMFEP